MKDIIMNMEELNTRFGIGKQLKFVEDPSGLVVAEIENPLASARLTLQGAHLLAWRPRSTSVPVVWYSEKARLIQGRPAHSGAPVCWPWFGVHPNDPGLPAHGFARNHPWEVIGASAEEDGATRLTLRLLQGADTHAQWPHSSLLTLDVLIGETLRMTLTTTNTGDEEFVIGEAFHTYFQVADIAKVKVVGLEGCAYLDKVENFVRKQQEGVIDFTGETDRVYVDTEAECVIEDPGLRRRIRIAKSGSATTVVWTPWQEKAAGIDDIGDQWPRMLCVESANAAHNMVKVAPRSTHALTVEYRTEPL
jgi:glucose-6-phosphate 1-epimerase